MKKLMLSLALLSSVTISNACGWWPEGDMVRFYIFGSDLGGGEDMSDLYYSPHVFHWYKRDEYSGPYENLQEWKAFFGDKFSPETIDQLIYSDDKEEKVKDNALLKHFKGGNDKEAFEYIVFSKLLEKQLEIDPWDKKEIDYAAVQKSVLFAEKKRSEVSNEVIKLRYAFQLVVMHYYLNNKAEMEKYYKVVQDFPEETVIKTWAKFYYANKQNWDTRMFLLAQVFDDSKSKNRYIYQNYPSTKESVRGALNMCKTDEEKAAILSILAFKNPGRAKDQFEEVANLNPNNELTDILLIREINKLEDWYLSNKFIGFGPSVGMWSETFEFIKDENFESDKLYLKSFRSSVENIYKEKNIENKELWLTSLAYMSYMLDEEKITEKYLKAASKVATDPKMRGQIAIIDLLHLVKYQESWDPKYQETLAEGIKRVEDLKDHIYNYDKFYAEIMLAISRKYLSEGDLVLAALWESKINGAHQYEPYSQWGDETRGYQAFDLLNENAYSKEMDEFFAFWNQPGKTEMEEWLFADLEPYKWRLTDLWATTYFREDKLPEALKIYKTIPDSVWHVDNWKFHYYYAQELDNDPFETNMVGRSYGPNQSGKTYTKPEFIEEIMRLKALIDGPVKDKSYYALLLGNAYYNMSHGGNSYYYTEYGWGSYDDAGFRSRDMTYYYTAERALDYYKMAEDWAPNDAYAAFCYRMQMKCRRAAYFHSEEYNYKKVKQLQVEDWMTFAKKYPEHYKKLTNCDHYTMYSNAWKRG